MPKQSASIEVEGLSKLARALKKADETELVALLKEANQEASKDVENAARPLIPQLTGKLAASLRSTGTAQAGYVRAGKKAVPYAGVIHFGWPAHNIGPQPFLFDALDERKGEVERLFETRIKALCAQIEADT